MTHYLVKWNNQTKKSVSLGRERLSNSASSSFPSFCKTNPRSSFSPRHACMMKSFDLPASVGQAAGLNWLAISWIFTGMLSAPQGNHELGYSTQNCHNSLDSVEQSALADEQALTKKWEWWWAWLIQGWLTMLFHCLIMRQGRSTQKGVCVVINQTTQVHLTYNLQCAWAASVLNDKKKSTLLIILWLPTELPVRLHISSTSHLVLVIPLFYSTTDDKYHEVMLGAVESYWINDGSDTLPHKTEVLHKTLQYHQCMCSVV